ncbi:SHOCT domain-containing protein [Actinomyces sp. MRS3W]|uniref:SHOCT domain-containing protein n=1 Tax=Actinomyces sp. MRS3W TaxID=2800796 RepID=UPI0028FD0B45|nr:SHOCT domain-containing protein [Actinomyces sp. MRS3W]MDU0347394.1 SHOCT domain-containing protein [Actinomyces sp. MRS3W]
MEPLMQFKSHIAGKNADVAIYPDRIVWSRKGRLGAGSKAALGVMTMGASLLATGIRRSEDGEVIPISSISHVGKRRGKGLNTEVMFTTSGGDLVMRVGHGLADRVIDTVMAIQRGDAQLAPVDTAPVYGQTPAQAPTGGYSVAPEPAAPASGGEDVMAQIQQLAGLRDAGALTEEEFAAKKAELLSRL